jgi:hypothetical protein
MTALLIRDETTLGKRQHEFMLDFDTERITVRELIRRRVYEEVEAFNSKQPEEFYSLVQPTDTEVSLNGYKLRQPKQINWETQFKKALEAFAGNGFIILVNERQVDDLGDIIEIVPDTAVTFLKLVPLVGG